MRTFFSVLFLSFVLIGFGHASPVVLDRRGVSADQLAMFNLMEQYAAAAYCEGNNDSPNTTVTCPAGNCPLVEQASSTTTSEFENSIETDTTGFVAVDPTHQIIVISFRGSRSIRNWLANLSFNTVSVPICPSCTSHAGFWASWQEIKPTIVSALQSAVAAHPDYDIAVTGHSLGGAVATLAAAELRTLGLGRKVSLYSFGAPRVGGEKLSSFITAQDGDNYRVTHWNDAVPRLPLTVMGYRHISPEYYIDRSNGQGVGVGDVKIFQGSLNWSGNSKWLITDLSAHLWYFGDVSGCAKGILELRDIDDETGVSDRRPAS